MSWVNKHIFAAISPKWAFGRLQYAAGVKAYYEAAEPTRLHKQPLRSGSADVVNRKAGTKIRDWARHLDENYDVASGVLDVLVANTIGSIITEPLVETVGGDPAEDVNVALVKLYDDWVHACDVTRELDVYSLDRLAGRSLYRDGECFGQRLIGDVPGLKHGTVLPYSLQAFEADYVPLDYDDLAKNIRQGVQLNKWGAPTRYFVSRSHPGDRRAIGIYAADYQEVAAERVMHLKMVKRLHQVRGMSVLAPAIARFDDLKEGDETERVAMRVAAAMTGFIKKGLPEMYVAQRIGDSGTPEKRQMDFVPGMIFDDLKPGEDVGTIASNRPNNALIPFRDSQLRSAASGAMVSYSSASKNYNGTYSAQRQELVEQFGVYRMLSQNFVFRWKQPTWDGFIDAVIASGAVTIGSDVDRSTIYNASHTTPPMPWIDPESEVQAAILAEEHHYESKSGTIRRRGANPHQVYREIQRDEKQLEARGIISNDAPAPDPADDDAKAQRVARAVFRLQRRRAQ